jgi:hypothetical protein
MRDLSELKMIKASLDDAIPQVIGNRLNSSGLNASEINLVLDIALKSSITGRVIRHMERYGITNRFIEAFTRELLTRH